MKIADVRLAHMRAALAHDPAIQFSASTKPFEELASSIICDGREIKRDYICLKELLVHRKLSENQLLGALHAVCGTLSTLHAIGIAHGDITDKNIFFNPKTSHAMLSLNDRGVAIDRDKRETRPDWIMRRKDFAGCGVPFEVMYMESQGAAFETAPMMHDAPLFIKRIRSDLALYDVACLGHAFEGAFSSPSNDKNNPDFHIGDGELSGAVRLMISPRFINQKDIPCQISEGKFSILSRPSMNNVRKILESAEGHRS